MKTRSLVRRTIAVALLAELLGAMASSLTALHHERYTRLRTFDVMLRGRSDSVLGAIQDAEDENDAVTVDPAELKVPPDDAFAVYNLGGQLVGESPNAPGELVARSGNGFFNRRRDGRSYRVFEREGMRVIDRSETKGKGIKRPVVIVYAASNEYVWHEVREAAGFYAAVSCVILIVTGGLLVVLLRKVLEPIGELAERARGVSVLAPRFVAPESALQVHELQPLAQTLAAAIGGLREALEKEHRFVGDAAHELKTAVAVERSTIQVLMMRQRSREEYAQGLEALLGDNRRVETLIAQMLLLARVEETNAAAVSRTDLSAAARSVLDKLQNLAEASGIKLRGEFAEGLDCALSRENAEVLISNLVMNAVQHSSIGSGIKVTTTLRSHSMLLQVHDQGAGISAEALPHVFERFYREDASRSRTTGGSGLGLAICKSIVEAVGGGIDIESAPGQVTVVSVTFQRAQGSTPAKNSSRPAN